MVTQRTNLADLVTVIPSGSKMNTGDTSLTDSFQTFVAEGGQRWKNEPVFQSEQRNRQMKADQSHMDTYEKVSADSYSMNKKRIQSDTKQSNESVEEVTNEQMEELQENIRNVLKEVLDISDAEIDEILMAENMSIFSLLQPDNLQTFLLAATENEPVDLLTNSTLIEVFQNMNHQMNTALQMSGLEEADLKQILAEDWKLPENMEDILPMQTADTVESGGLEFEKQSVQEEAKGVVESRIRQPEGQLIRDTESEQLETVVVKEETTGIAVSLQSAGKKEGNSSGQQTEQNPQTVAADVVNQLSQAMNELEETSSSFTSDIQQADIVRQVIEQIKVFSGNDMNRIEVQLYPQHLGRLQIQVMMKNGVMTAQIHAETEMAKEAIESQLQQLKETFQERNIQVNAVEVSVGTSNFQREQERQDSAGNQQRTRTRGRRIQLDEFGMPVDDLATEEAIVSERLEAQGASVEFTA